ncbi:unnamed protein product [Rotaria magnacalcarata]
MLFFRRRDSLSRSNLTDQERCIHACLFLSFILLILTILLFYFGTTSKVYIRRFYGGSASSTHHRGITSESEHECSKYSNNDA